MTQKQFHEENATVRIYGRNVTEWYENKQTGECKVVDRRTDRALNFYHWTLKQWEVAYTEYRLNGDIKQVGSRDFTDGTRKQTKRYEVCLWDGVRKWKNGFRSYTPYGHILTDRDTRPYDIIKVLKAIDGHIANAADVRLDII